MKEEGFESEPRQDEFAGVEVDVGENVGHDIVDDVTQTGQAIQQQGHALRGDPGEEA